MDEGYIKFNCGWIKDKPISKEKTAELIDFRNKLHEMGLIGAYHNGIGFGNISIRDDNEFIISGSATGNISKLNKKHFTRVINYDVEKNSVECRGPVIASSESMTHAAIYEADSSINAVIHVHSLELWKKLLNNAPTTRNVPYGTVEMVKEICRLFEESDALDKKIIVMAGHQEGVICFGADLKEAYAVISKYYFKNL